MAQTVSTGIGTLKNSLREVNAAVKLGFKLGKNTPKMMIGAGETFLFDVGRIRERLKKAIKQINANWKKLKEMGVDLGELRYALNELRTLRSYFEYLIANKKLPQESWGRTFASLVSLGYATGNEIVKYNEKPMMPYVVAVIQKIPA